MEDGLSLLDRHMVFGYVGGCFPQVEGGLLFSCIGWIEGEISVIRGPLLSGICHAPCTVGGYKQRDWWGNGMGFGTSGALSPRGMVTDVWIDGVVMRDGDVREQTPIQSGTSERGLLGSSGAHHHLQSLAWAGEDQSGGRDRKRKG